MDKEKKNGFRAILAEDFKANETSFKGSLLVCLFRIAWWVRRRPRWIYLLMSLYVVFYRVMVEWFLGVELPPATEVGPGLAIHHGQGLVVNNRSRIGSHCILRHGVTIGNSGKEGEYGCPVLEDDVNVGAGAVILGEIRIGKGAVIGALAVVLKDVPAGAIAVGNPARIIERNAGDV